MVSQKEIHRNAKLEGSIALYKTRAGKHPCAKRKGSIALDKKRAGKHSCAKNLFRALPMPLLEGFLNNNIYAEYNQPSAIELATMKRLQASLNPQ